MKKSIKVLALGMAVLPCALMLTACGGDKDIVNIEGDYQAVQTSSYSAITADVDAGLDLNEVANGCKALITIDATSTIQGLGEIELGMRNEIIAKANQNDGQLHPADLELYQKSTMDVTVTNTLTNEKAKMSNTAKQYLVDGTQYIDFSGSQALLDVYKAMNPEKDMPTRVYQVLLSGEGNPVDIPEVSLGDLLTLIPEGQWGEDNDLQISKSVSETGYKVKVVVKNSFVNSYVGEMFAEQGLTINFTEDVEAYFVYENEEFAGFYLDADAEVNVTMPEEYASIFGSTLTVDANINAQIIGYEGNISYPNFNGYVNLDA